MTCLFSRLSLFWRVIHKGALIHCNHFATVSASCCTCTETGTKHLFSFTFAVRSGQWLLYCKQRTRIGLWWFRSQQKDPHLDYRYKYNVIVKFVQDGTMYHATAWMFKLWRKDGGKRLLSMCCQWSVIKKVGTFRHISLLWSNHNKLFCTLALSALNKLNFRLPSNVLQPEASTTMDSVRPWLKSCLHYTVTRGIQYEKLSQL